MAQPIKLKIVLRDEKIAEAHIQQQQQLQQQRPKHDHHHSVVSFVATEVPSASTLDCVHDGDLLQINPHSYGPGVGFFHELITNTTTTNPVLSHVPPVTTATATTNNIEIPSVPIVDFINDDDLLQINPHTYANINDGGDKCYNSFYPQQDTQ